MITCTNVVALNTFYKVVVLEVDILETEIMDERHFSTEAEARIFCEAQERKGYITILVRMEAKEDVNG